MDSADNINLSINGEDVQDAFGFSKYVIPVACYD